MTGLGWGLTQQIFLVINHGAGIVLLRKPLSIVQARRLPEGDLSRGFHRTLIVPEASSLFDRSVIVLHHNILLVLKVGALKISERNKGQMRDVTYFLTLESLWLSFMMGSPNWPTHSRTLSFTLAADLICAAF